MAKKDVNNDKAPGASGRNSLEKTSTYKVDGRAFIVEPVFKRTGNETIGTVLVKLMKADTEKP